MGRKEDIRWEKKTVDLGGIDGRKGKDWIWRGKAERGISFTFTWPWTSEWRGSRLISLPASWRLPSSTENK